MSSVPCCHLQQANRYQYYLFFLNYCVISFTKVENNTRFIEAIQFIILINFYTLLKNFINFKS